ncbi:MAG: hypothetical protein DMG38_22780 [Acidobacteria bacterium]|nr:MAG: hypothetical protein DMG38_22780 [Acidobacteriota bacterium]
MVAKKGKPALGWFGMAGCTAHPAGDRSIGNIKTKHEELAMDARCAPRWIFNNHPEDQFWNFLRRPSSPNLRPGSGRPAASTSGNRPGATALQSQV